MTVALLLLAAGASRRMQGRDKLMEPVRGMSLLQDRAQMVLGSTATPVIAVMHPARPDRRLALKGLSLQLVDNPDADTGMASSIKIGLSAQSATATATIMLPADMPNVTAQHLDLLIAEHALHPNAVLRATGTDGVAKSPTLVPRAAWPLLLELTGDQGGRSALNAYQGPTRHVLLDGTDPTLDLDTPDAWAAWRSANPEA